MVDANDDGADRDAAHDAVGDDAQLSRVKEWVARGRDWVKLQGWCYRKGLTHCTLLLLSTFPPRRRFRVLVVFLAVIRKYQHLVITLVKKFSMVIPTFELFVLGMMVPLIVIGSTDKLFRKIRLFSQPPKKSSSNFFWVAQDLILVQLILIMQKITKNSLFGHFLGYPPKMHYSALQCSAMYWSANAWIIHSRWVK